MIGLPELTLDGTINSVQVLLELLGEPMNAYGLKHHIWVLATTVEITCEVNLVKKSCFQFGVLDCLIGLNRSGVFSI